MYITCVSGYVGNEVNCLDVDECINSPCDANGICQNTGGGFTCDCNPGYQRDGVSCADIDECIGNNTCDENA